jgi:putative N6-adenine-specific DNA methylase
MKTGHFEMIAKTLSGLEDVLANELTSMGAEAVETGRRMVSFTGDKAMLYKANFCCRTALRILKPITHFKADNADTVYHKVKNIDWDKYLSLDKTFAVDAVVYSGNFNHSKFVAYRTKDAIADYFNDKYGTRPSVRINNPDIYVNVHISHDDCTVSLDSSGESLHRRGYRVNQVDAPLNEVLAAGMILKTGWRGESNFVDPMCGSGTLLIEAAMIALNMAPGVCRKGYAFERWPDFDPDLFDEIYNDDSEECEFKFKCYGSDISPVAVEKAMKNVRSAGLSKYIELKTMPFQQFGEALKPGILITNPPYGERISANDIFELYSMIGERLKHVFTGYNAWILSYKEECFEKIGLRPKQKIKLMNGELECEYRCYELFEGTNKEYKRELKNRDSQRGYGWNENDVRRDSRGERQRKYDESRKHNSQRSAGGDRKSFSKGGKSFGRDDNSLKKEHRAFSRQYKPYDQNRKTFK